MWGFDVQELHALVVEDDPDISSALVETLEGAGFRVTSAPDGRQAVSAAAADPPDLVTLDLTLPHMDGIEVCRRIRETSDCYIVIVSARSDEVDKLIGLEVGADDFVLKPFSPRELAIRVRNMLRRVTNVPTQPGGLLEFGPLRIDPAAREAVVDGRAVALTPKEFDLLHFLARSPRQVFSRRQLLAQVWDSAPEFQDPATVTVHVGRLRQKLEVDPEHPRWILTAWGVGYRFEP